MRTTDEQTTVAPALFVIDGDASDEEVAALVAVLGLSATANPAAPPRRRRSEWAAAHRAVGLACPPGPGAWRSSALPR